jgi:hypothetical protein
VLPGLASGLALAVRPGGVAEAARSVGPRQADAVSSRSTSRCKRERRPDAGRVSVVL